MFPKDMTLTPEQIIETMWHVFDIESRREELKPYGDFNKETVKDYIFNFLLVEFLSSGYKFIKIRNKRFVFRNIIEDYNNMLIGEYSVSANNNLIVWLQDRNHYPDSIKDWSDFSDINAGIHFKYPLARKLLTVRQSNIFATDYFFWYMGMCGYRLSKKGKQEDRLSELVKIYKNNKITNYILK